MNQFVLDPNKAFAQVNPRRIIEAVGIIPSWLANRLGSETFMEALERQYPSWSGTWTGESGMLEDGTHTYPEDPDLPPFMKVESDEEEAYIYQYSIVGVRNKKTKEVSFARID